MSPRISVIEQEHSIGLTDKPRDGLKMEGEGREIGDRHKAKRLLQSGERFATLISLLLGKETFYLWGF